MHNNRHAVLGGIALVCSFSLSGCLFDTDGENPAPEMMEEVPPPPPPAPAEEPSDEQVDGAVARLEVSLDAVRAVRAALELLGVLPVYECSEPRASFIGDLVAGAELQLACATITTTAAGPDADAVVIVFPADGCEVGGRVVSGVAQLLYSGGEDAMSVEADFSALKVDGTPLGASVGYEKCGDTDTYWASAAGALPGSDTHSYAVDIAVSVEPGLPFIGSTTLILNGSAQVDGPAGSDILAFDALSYELGDTLPGGGSVIIDTAEGTHIEITFEEVLPFFRTIRVVIDDHAPVTVPFI